MEEYENTEHEYNGIVWSTIDIEGCELALWKLYEEGVDPEVLRSLDFGCLNVAKVLEEMEEAR